MPELPAPRDDANGVSRPEPAYDGADPAEGATGGMELASSDPALSFAATSRAIGERGSSFASASRHVDSARTRSPCVA